MPAYRLAFAVGVRREIDFGVLGDSLREALDGLFLFGRDDVLRLEAVLDVDAERPLRQVAYMSLGREHVGFSAEIFLDGLRL